MPANIEVKAKLVDPAAAHLKAARLSGGPPEIISQTDVFFPCRDGRLKLRMFEAGLGELILYQRANAANARRSDYQITRTNDAQGLLQILTDALGSCGRVKKTRSLYLVGQTRIHIDNVQGLGDFLEIEVVLKPGQTDLQGRQIADALLKELGVKSEDCVPLAYVDLLKQAT